ncbi:hypothetical protein SK128_003218 [Halocaridina rubra]|uniref:Uncharacterized protein n=1 Tax=Halocaridina rubra TaxID=373956 RepID=A0AAN8WBI9_HALRR
MPPSSFSLACVSARDHAQASMDLRRCWRSHASMQAFMHSERPEQKSKERIHTRMTSSCNIAPGFHPREPEFNSPRWLTLLLFAKVTLKYEAADSGVIVLY